jgi:hypothetical protein
MESKRRGILRSMHILSAMAVAAVLSDTALPQPCTDVALVLAVDGSSSIDAEEYAYQQKAIAAALRDTKVLKAMKQTGTVAIAVVFWGDPNRPVDEAGPVIVEDAPDAESFAQTIENIPRRVRGYTGLSVGLGAALDRLSLMPSAHRSVISVSGDGRGTVLARRNGDLPSLAYVRSRAAEQGVTISALVVSKDERKLLQYFGKQVITDPDAFAIEVADFPAFAGAIRHKLIREITPITISCSDVVTGDH